MMNWISIRDLASGNQTSHAFDGLDGISIKKGTKAACGFALGGGMEVGSMIGAVGKDLPVVCEKCARLDPDVRD